MTNETTNRQLAAIVFSDIKGYTSMMQKDGEASLQMIEKFKRNHEELSKKHNGKIIQYYGDACLMTFDSVVEAVNCSLAMQMNFRKDPEVPVRIGVHLGDVVFTDGNVFGDAVNVASRVESMGVPGTILFSETVAKNLSSHPEFEYLSLGSYEFKNVAHPLEIFALTNNGLPIPRKEEMKGKLKEKPKKKSKILPILGLLLLLATIAAIAINIVNKNNRSLDLSDAGVEPSVTTLIPTKEVVRQGHDDSQASMVQGRGTFTDTRDGEVYKWVKFSNGEKWMADNLRYDNGQSKCYDGTDSCDEYGRLYTWNESISACPEGWKLPSDKRWTNLIALAKGESAGYFTLTDGESDGFQAALGGSLDDEGQYDYKGVAGNYWTSTSYDIVTAGWVTFSKNIEEIKVLHAVKKMGFSCRCMEDANARKGSVGIVTKNNSTDASQSKNVPLGSSSLSQAANENGASAVSMGDEVLKGTLTFNSASQMEIVIISSPTSGVDADLKIGKKKGSQRDEGLIRISLSDMRITHDGNAYVYFFGSDGWLENVVDADLKIGKKKSAFKENRKNEFVDGYVLISGEDLGLNGIMGGIKIDHNNGSVTISENGKVISKITIESNADISTIDQRINYKIKKDQVGMAIIRSKSDNL